MLVTIEQPNPTQGSAHVSHAVVLEECLPTGYKLKNSYKNDPIIIIPNNRKTFRQNHIQVNASDFSPKTSEDVIKKMELHSGIKIEWDTKEWILNDVGYSLQFRLKK